MTQVDIIHNPFTVETTFLIDGVELTDGARLHRCTRLRMQLWVDQLFQDLKTMFNGYDTFNVSFTGVEPDFRDLEAADRFRSECDQPEVPANARPPSGSRLTAASGRSGTRPGPRTDPGTLPARPKAQRHPVASRLARDARGFPPAVPSGRGLAGHDLVGRVGVPARQHRARAAGNDALQRARRGLHGFRRHHAWIRRDSVVACGRAACRRGDPAGRALARK